MDSTTRLRSRLAVQPLEDRSVPALLISDVGATGLFFNSTTEQFFELRGDPGTSIPGRTYFVTVDGSAGTAAGTINSVFDLGGVQLGSSGYLAVIQANSPYTVDGRSGVLRGTTTGFGGLGGTAPDRFSDNSGLSNEFEFIVGSNSYLLVTAQNPPVPGADVDVNDDGLLDSSASTWTVLDSVGMLGPTLTAGATETSYGRITFSQGGLGRVPFGSVVVDTTSSGYVARVGESTGYAASDWMAGRFDNVGTVFRLENSLFGNSSDPYHYTAGLRTDQLGGSNFVSAVYGRVYTDANGNGTFDTGDVGVAGQTVWADQNTNGLLDSYETTFSIASSGLAVGTELTNVVPGATMTLYNTGVNQEARSIQVSQTVFNNTQRIGSNNVGFFASFHQLRVDFYRPSSSVSIDFFDDVPGTGPGGTGRLEAYSADGTLLDFTLVPVQRGTTGGTMTITRPSADIAYVLAFTDPTTTANGYYDNLRFTTPESSATTAADGSYKVGGLLNGDHSIRTIGGSLLTTITNLVPVRGVDFPTGGGIGGGGGGGGSGVGGTGRTLAVGGGPGAVTVYGAVGGVLSQASIVNFPVLFPDAPFDGTFRTATGDVNGDGAEDVVVVTGPGSPVRWGAIDGRTGNTLLVPLTTAFSGSDDFTGGGFVSVGDLDGDGRAEIVLTPDQGGGARVTIFSVFNVGARLRGNHLGIEDKNFRGGARTALGDVNGDGRADLLVAAGFQGGPRVAIYDGRAVLTTGLSRLTADFFAFDPSLRNGVFASIGDLDGDGFGDLVIGAGSGGAPAVRILSGRTLTRSGGPGAALANPIADFFMNGDSESRSGVRVTTKNVNGDGRADVIAATGEGQFSQVRVYSGATTRGRSEPAPIQDIDPFGVVLAEGVFVG